MKFGLFSWFLKDYEMPNKYKLAVADNQDNEYSLAGLCSLLAKEVAKLEKRVVTLEQQYASALVDINRLEEENVEIVDRLCENERYIQAVDARIDIIAEHYMNK